MHGSIDCVYDDICQMFVCNKMADSVMHRQIFVKEFMNYKPDKVLKAAKEIFLETGTNHKLPPFSDIKKRISGTYIEPEYCDKCYKGVRTVKFFIDNGQVFRGMGGPYVGEMATICECNDRMQKYHTYDEFTNSLTLCGIVWKEITLNTVGIEWRPMREYCSESGGTPLEPVDVGEPPF